MWYTWFIVINKYTHFIGGCSMSNNRILTELPRKGNANRLDYMKMIGMDLKIEYKDEEYEIKIIEYISAKNPRFKIEYNGEIKEIQCGNFISGRFGGILNEFTKSFKFKTGDEIKDDKRDIVITDREYRKGKRGVNWKWYKYTCNKCGWTEGWIEERHLLSGVGCSCCANQTAVLGINTIWDTDRWLCTDYGLDENFARTHTMGSGEKASFTCVCCGKVKEAIPTSVRENRSIGCICSDNISYPEKFVYSTLKQLVGAEFKTQLNKSDFDWIGGYRYDFYIPSKNTIIETHGMQHYREGGRGRGLAEEQENDKLKEEIAKQNGITEYIIIDCRNSNLDWIKNSILNSKLNELFDLSIIDWSKCEEFALSNLVKEVCQYWNNRQEGETTATLMKVFGLSRKAVTSYLKRGAVLGFCEYNPKEEVIKNSRVTGKSNGKANGKRVAMYDLDGNFIMEEHSTHELVRRFFAETGIKLSQGNISAVCSGKLKTHKGYIFKYLD